MPRQIISDDLWQRELNLANQRYTKWESQFRCDKLEEYYEGKQYLDQDNDSYVINKIFETVQIKIDSFCPETPVFILNPRPGNSDFDLETAALSTQIKESVLNTIIMDSDEVFVEETKAAYKDSFFRFGVLEVGYAAEWVTNPNVSRPLLNKDTKKEYADKARIIGGPPEVPINERVYIKHIDAKTFRVGGQDHPYLKRCDWYGYYEFVRKDDLLVMDGLMNRDKLEMAGSARGNNDRSVIQTSKENDPIDPDQSMKIWHIWHNKAKVKIVLVDSPCITIFQRTFKRQAIFDYCLDKRVTTKSFYPVPPVYHWISPQNELNETRQQLRAHRRRFGRKYQMQRDSVNDEEIEKFENGPDGSLIITETAGPILPIQDANLGTAPMEMLQISTTDLNEISGTSANARAVADRTTATEASFINNRATIRESAEQQRVSKFLCRIGREILLTARDKFTLGFWAMMNSDTKESLFQEVKVNKASYEWVTSEDLSDGFDFRIEVDVTTISLAAKEAEKKKFFEFMALVGQYPAIAMSPKLLRQAAYSVGFKNEAIIKEMQQMAMLQQMGQMAQLGGMQNGNMAQQQVAQSTPPGAEAIRQQIGNQQPLQ